jgi:hypothetical protein
MQMKALSFRLTLEEQNWMIKGLKE